MRRNFLYSSAKLILLGLALGFLARYLFGIPASSTDHHRQFTSPVERNTASSNTESEDYDFALPANWASESK